MRGRSRATRLAMWPGVVSLKRLCGLRTRGIPGTVTTCGVARAAACDAPLEGVLTGTPRWGGGEHPATAVETTKTPTVTKARLTRASVAARGRKSPPGRRLRL